MANNEDEQAYNEALLARVKELREKGDWTAEQMAIALNVSPHSYRKYEVRSPMPAYLMERFATITGVSIEYLVTGKRGLRSQRKD